MFLFSLLFLVFYVSAASLNSTRVPNPNVSNNDIKWLDIDHSVLVRLETPNIPLYVWNQGKEAISPTEKPSAVIINFTLSHDHSALLIQGQPFLPFAYDSIPPLLEAYQVPADEFAPPGPNSKLPPFSFDYAREVYPRDDRSVKYENYHPILTLDILGAGTQNIIGIQLKDSNSFPLSRKKKGSSFEIVKIWLSNRPSDELPPIYESRKCGLWTYRCADLAEPPWYKYVSRQDFDEYGRLGSLRHLLVKRWSILCETIGFTRFMIFITVVAGVTLWPMAHRIYRYVRRTRARWSIEHDEVEDWLADEEEADLLSDQDFLRRERRFKEDQEMAVWARQHPVGVSVLPPWNPDIYGSSEKL